MARATLLAARAVAAVVAVVASAAAGGAARAQLVDYEPAAKASPVQQDAAWRLAFRPGMQVLTQTVGQLRSVAPVDIQKQLDALVAEAAKQDEPAARRTLWKAVSLMGGQAWSPQQELAGAVALRTPSQIWTGAGDVLTLDTLYPVPGAGSARYELKVYASQPTTSATPKKGALLRTLTAGQAAKFPASVKAPLGGLPDGAYLLIADVSVGAARTQIVQPVYLLTGLDARYSALRKDLAGISGHAEARALIEYPYALATAMRAGKREIISYDFPAALKRSSDLLAALKAGRDPVRQAKGLQNRAYRFAETGELIPYQVYVPSTWTPDKAWPLMVALHGANLDETNMLGRDGARMQKLAEEHGFVVVTPLGYRLNSAYGSQRGFSRQIVGAEADRRRRSEDDVLAVTALVEKEYNIDPRRRYLTGNSMGGGGTWWIGGKYPEMWAAIAPGAYGGVLPEDVPALAKLPIHVVVGDRDDLMLDRVRETVAVLKAGGAAYEYVEVPGGTHPSAFEIDLPEIFKFFEKHSK